MFFTSVKFLAYGNHNFKVSAAVQYLITLSVLVLSLVFHYSRGAVSMFRRKQGDSTCDPACSSNHLIYRVGVSFSLEQLMLFLLMFTKESVAVKIHNNFFAIKILLLIMFFGVAHFVPTKVISIYGRMAEYLSTIFFMIKTLIILSSFNRLHLFATNSLGRNGRHIIVGKGFASLFMLLFAYLGVLRMDSEHVALRSPISEQVATRMPIIASLLLLLFSCSRWCIHGALLPSSAITLYLTLLGLASVRINRAEYANQLAAMSTVVTSATLAASLAIMAYDLSYGDDNIPVEMPSVSELNGVDDNSIDDIPFRKGILKSLHFVLLGGSFFIPTAATNWAASSEDVGKWIVVASSYLCLSIFAWVVIAPVCVSKVHVRTV